MSAKRRPKDAGVYVFRTRKPGAFWGFSARWALLATAVIGGVLYAAHAWWWLAPLVLISVSGRHFGYVGEGYNRALRETEHLKGATRFVAKPKNWNDLEPRFYRIPTFRGHSRIWRLIQEWIWHAILLPVYGDRPYIPWNFRKITAKRAQWQRWARDELGLLYKIPRALVRYGAVGLIIYLSFAINYQDWSPWS